MYFQLQRTRFIKIIYFFRVDCFLCGSPIFLSGESTYSFWLLIDVMLHFVCNIETNIFNFKCLTAYYSVNSLLDCFFHKFMSEFHC